jgi:hypothetical protein
MAKTRAGDWRDTARIRSWAATVARELAGPSSPAKTPAD